MRSPSARSGLGAERDPDRLLRRGAPALRRDARDFGHQGGDDAPVDLRLARERQHGRGIAQRRAEVDAVGGIGVGVRQEAHRARERRRHPAAVAHGGERGAIWARASGEPSASSFTSAT